MESGKLSWWKLVKDLGNIIKTTIIKGLIKTKNCWMKKIHIYTQYYRPVSNAPASRIEKYVKALKDNYDIIIITWMPNYPTWIKDQRYRWKLFLKETWPYWEKIVRTYEFPTKNEWFFKRTLNYVSFMLSSFIYWLFATKPDLIIVTSPPLFSAIWVLWLNKIRKIPYILEIRDLWPQSVVALWLMKKESLSYKIFSWFERKIYGNAKRIIVVTKWIQKEIEKMWYDKVVLQYNVFDWSNLKIFSKKELEDFKNKYNIPRNKKVFVYAWNHSKAQRLENILNLAKDYKNWIFYMLGDGETKQELENIAKKDDINNIHFLWFQNKETVYKFIQIADFCITSLDDTPLFEDAIPTKTLEYLAYWKPVIAFLRWDLANKIEEYQAWIVYPKYNIKLVEDIEKFNHNPKNSIKLVKDYFSFESFKDNVLNVVNKELWKN